jgi:putative transposase
MSNYRRHYIPGGSWFFTVNLKNRHSDLLIRHIALLRRATSFVKQRKPFHIDAWVVLPDHMHCIWTLPANDSDFSGRWRDLKKMFTRSLNRGEVWQPRFWEHTLRDEEDMRRHRDYININPVKHGWVERVRDWPYSTFHRDVRDGIYPPDWAGEVGEWPAGERREA